MKSFISEIFSSNIVLNNYFFDLVFFLVGLDFRVWWIFIEFLIFKTAFLSYFFLYFYFMLCAFLMFPFSSLLSLYLWNIFVLFFSSLRFISFYSTSSCYLAISSLSFYISVLWWFLIPLGFPGGSDGKESAFSVGDLGSVPRLGRSPGEGNTTYSRIVAWKIPWTEKPGGLQSMG